ncbi:MAG: hypothetical protein M3R12_10220 [Actinomycetota bacterium]|nr:hypothetical protein [Actinomycetota bacterium]
MRALLAVLALASTAAAVAADLPTAYGMAQRGSFKVVSNVILSSTGGEMKGVWLDGKKGCLDTRRLRVSIQIDLVSPAAKTTRIKRERSGAVDNCAEGGPNYGFDLTPRAYGMACANGRWRPGRYSMTTRTTDLGSGLMAQASLYHHVTRRC